MAHEEAIRYYKAVLHLLERAGRPADSQCCEVLLLLNEALWRAGEFDLVQETALHAVDVARRLRAPAQLARAALGFAGQLQGFGAVSCDESVVALLQEALDTVGDPDSALRARLMARLAEELAFTRSDKVGRSLAREAIEVARREADPEVLAAVLKTTHWALWAPEEADNRLALADEVVRLAAQTAERTMRLEGQLFRVWSLIELGESTTARHELRACSLLAEEIRQPYFQWIIAVTRGCLAFMTGRLDLIEPRAKEAMHLGQEVQNQNVALFHRGQLAHLYWLTGRFQELEQLLAGMRYAHPLLIPTVSCSLAGSFCEQNREAETRAEFERWAVDQFAALPRSVTWLSNVVFLALACAFLGDERRAEQLYDMLSLFADRG